MLAWLRLKSDSVWPAAVFRVSHNVVVPGVFDSLIRNTDSTLWYTSEFGAALTITSAVLPCTSGLAATKSRTSGVTASSIPAMMPTLVSPQ
jgi:hypothetical protein